MKQLKKMGKTRGAYNWMGKFMALHVFEKLHNEKLNFTKKNKLNEIN